MTSERAFWWSRVAQALSRGGLLWLAVTAVALTSFASAGAGGAASARMLAASPIGKFKPNAPGAPTILPEDSNRTNPQAQAPLGDAKRLDGTRLPPGLIPASAIPIWAVAREDQAAIPHIPTAGSTPRFFSARAPPERA